MTRYSCFLTIHSNSQQLSKWSEKSVCRRMNSFQSKNVNHKDNNMTNLQLNWDNFSWPMQMRIPKDTAPHHPWREARACCLFYHIIKSEEMAKNCIINWKRIEIWKREQLFRESHVPKMSNSEEEENCTFCHINR